jgi:hypothetical protein
MPVSNVQVQLLPYDRPCPSKNREAKICELILHEQIPGQVAGVLLKNASLVSNSQSRLFPDRCRAWHAIVANVMDKRREDARRLSDGVRCDTICAIMQNICPAFIDAIGDNSINLGIYDTRKKLYCGHCYKRSVFTIVEWIVLVHGRGHGLNKLTELINNLFFQHD